MEYVAPNIFMNPEIVIGDLRKVYTLSLLAKAEKKRKIQTKYLKQILSVLTNYRGQWVRGLPKILNAVMDKADLIAKKIEQASKDPLGDLDKAVINLSVIMKCFPLDTESKLPVKNFTKFIIAKAKHDFAKLVDLVNANNPGKEFLNTLKNRSRDIKNMSAKFEVREKYEITEDRQYYPTDKTVYMAGPNIQISGKIGKQYGAM